MTRGSLYCPPSESFATPLHLFALSNWKLVIKEEGISYTCCFTSVVKCHVTGTCNVSTPSQFSWCRVKCCTKSGNGKWCNQSTSFLILISVSYSLLKIAQMRVLNINGFCKSSRSVKHVIVCNLSSMRTLADRHTIYFSHKCKTQTIFTAFNEYYKIVHHQFPWENYSHVLNNVTFECHL